MSVRQVLSLYLIQKVILMKFFIAVDHNEQTVDLLTEDDLIEQYDLDCEEVEEITNEVERIGELASLADVEIAWDRSDAVSLIAEELIDMDIEGVDDVLLGYANMLKKIAENPTWDELILKYS